MALRKVKSLVIVFALAAIFAGAFTVMTTPTTEAARCCWVMVCTQNPPIICWEECHPCPPFP